MSKWINLKDKDGSIHRIAVLGADVTHNGEVVISYNDYTDGIHPGYAELIKVDGVYYNNYNKREWNYYATKFNDFNSQVSNSIVDSLPEDVDLYIGKKKKEKKKTNKPLNINNTTAYFLTVIIYANRGADLYTYDGYSNLPPIYFTRRMVDNDSLEEVYKKKNIDEADSDELMEKINSSLKGKMHISNMPEDFKYEVSSGNKYYVNFCSCDDEDIFLHVALADEIKLDTALGIKSGVYDDNLSSALHQEIPFEITANHEVIRYSNNTNKHVI